MPARFVGGLTKRIAHLINVISLGNSQQSGGHLKDFVDLVNRHADQIDRLTFVDTLYLHRHYHPAYGNDPQAMDTAWALSNHEKLIDLKKDYQILPWGTLLQREAYARYLARITQDYQTDPLFATHINNSVKRHQNKGDSAAALRYVLEECAGTLALLEQDEPAEENSTLTYPGKLNKPVQSALKQHFTGNSSYFLDYKLDTNVKERPPFRSQFWQKPTGEHTGDDEAFGVRIGRLVSHGLPASPALRCDFLSDLMRLCDHYNTVENPTLH